MVCGLNDNLNVYVDYTFANKKYTYKIFKYKNFYNSYSFSISFSLPQKILYKQFYIIALNCYWRKILVFYCSWIFFLIRPYLKKLFLILLVPLIELY